MTPKDVYAGLDVSQETTSICVVDSTGATVWRGSCPTDPASIASILRRHAPGARLIGLETGPLSNWLTRALCELKLPVVCLDARHAKAALKLQVNKTDANDAWGLAQIVRTGWFREVAVKSMDAQMLRMLLVARTQLISQRQAIANVTRGLMKTFGLVIARGASSLFAHRVREAAAGNGILMAIVEPLLAAWQALREQIAIFDKQILSRSRTDGVIRRLMTIPGVGAIVALSYTAVIDNPARFRRSSSVGVYVGLTPRRYQSGEIDVSGHISKCGDSLLRSHLFEAANVILSRYSRTSALKAWGLKLAKHIGKRRAKVAVARKLAVIMHRIWADGSSFIAEGKAAS